MGDTNDTLHPQPLVSVVTPLYNGEQYIAECIESVLAQTYTNWEYIIVNNCSTDRSLELVQHYNQKDNRIRVYNNSELLSSYQNQNHALRQISDTSHYCKVVHADDWIFPECIMKMVELAEANSSVGIVAAYRLDDVWVNLDGLPYPSTVVPGREVCRIGLLRELYLFGSPTSLLIRSDLVRQHNPFYDESNLHADKAVCYDLLQESDFGFVHQVLTYTRRHNEQQTSFNRRVNSTIAGQLRTLKQYGPIYLTQEEYNRTIKRKTKAYYKFLGRSIFDFRNKEFWDYHKDELDKIGYSLSRAKLSLYAFLIILEKLFSPFYKLMKYMETILRHGR